MKKDFQLILKWICCLLLLAISNFIFAQNTFPEAIERYFRAKNDTLNFGNETMRAGLVQYTDGLRTLGKVKIPSNISSAEVADQYMEERITAEFLEAYVHYFSETGITIEQLNELSDLLETEEGKRAMSHSRIFESAENLDGITEIIINDMIKLSQGGKVENKSVNVSKERKALFSQYYKNAQLAKFMTSCVEIYSGLYAIDKKTGKNVRKYFAQNWETFLLSAADVLTDDDLVFLIEFVKYPQYSKCMAATNAFMEDIVTVSTAILGKYEVWLQEQRYQKKNVQF